jgi:hypothetical protein
MSGWPAEAQDPGHRRLNLAQLLTIFCQLECHAAPFCVFCDAAVIKRARRLDDGSLAAPYTVLDRTGGMTMAEGKGTNYAKLALGAGLLAAAAIGVAAFVPRRKLALVVEPLVGLAKLPVAAALTAWAMGLWHDATAPQAPVFDDLRPFDEF